ncbi:MAG: galactokinase [Bacteroidaceae bacterium]|nr:galactokinase [Bacteroidaceae bacterium]
MERTEVKDCFRKHFGHEGGLYFSPGRINLIGEHTDYNGGFVFPGAVDKGITAAIAPNGLDRCRVIAADIDEGANYAEFGLDESDKPSQHWASYIFGVCRELCKLGVGVRCFDAVFSGDVPLGAGMSSSAALESVFAFALNGIFDGGVDKFGLAKVGQATEHNYCGVMCGIMDQFASVFGKKGCLMRLDCRSLEYEYFPFDPKGYRLILLNSCVKHTLGNEYNERRASCENVVAHIARRHNGVETLRDATHEMLDEVKNEVSDTDWRRAKYVLDEKERVLTVCDALVKGDYELVGRKMYETHWGLSRDYGVSCEELDFLVEKAAEYGVTGSRLMGGGFGGCTINLVREELCEAFVKDTGENFAARFGHELPVYSVSIGDGSVKLQQ